MVVDHDGADEGLVGGRSVLLTGPLDELTLNSVVELSAEHGSVDDSAIELVVSVVVVGRLLLSVVELSRSSIDASSVVVLSGDCEVDDRPVELATSVLGIAWVVVCRFGCDNLNISHSFSMFVRLAEQPVSWSTSGQRRFSSTHLVSPV